MECLIFFNEYKLLKQNETNAGNKKELPKIEVLVASSKITTWM